MKIKGSDIKEDVRERYLIGINETLVIQEMEPGPRTGLRRFRLRQHAGGRNMGEIYFDSLEPGILERFDDVQKV